MSLYEYNRETRAERKARKERAERIVNQPRIAGKLNIAERMILANLRLQGRELNTPERGHYGRAS
jgi:hypothetical protein